LVGNWQNVLLSYDLELSNGNEDATGGKSVLAFELLLFSQSEKIRAGFLFTLQSETRFTIL
jgi:hypothetical protein